MSQKHKRGLQRGLSDIVERQTAPVEDKKRESADLISRFSESKSDPPPPPPTTSYHLLPPPSAETAPKRDFARVPNSITRDALPAGLFKGTSKKLYDALYLRTRGAIQPVREIKARQSELMMWAKVSHNTLRAHLRHLEASGLVIRKWELGDNDGAVYEVFVPEELPPPTTSYHHPQPPPTTNQKLGGPSNQNLVVGGGSQVPEKSTTSADPKTLIKTNTENDDDDAARRLLCQLQEVEMEITGKVGDPLKWSGPLAIIMAEFRVAASRSAVISSAPAFLEEHLRRRLGKSEARAAGGAGIPAAQSPPKPKREFTEEPCPRCKGALTVPHPEGGQQRCPECRSETGYPTGRKPKDSEEGNST